jgi:hypothetical protein
VEGPAHVLLPHRIAGGDEDVRPYELAGADEDGASPTAAAHDVDVESVDVRLRAPEDEGGLGDIDEPNGAVERVGQRSPVDVGGRAPDALDRPATAGQADSAAPWWR